MLRVRVNVGERKMKETVYDLMQDPGIGAGTAVARL